MELLSAWLDSQIVLGSINEVFLDRAHQDEQNGTTKIVESQMDAGLNVSNTILPLICEQNDENRRVNG